jgi:hypothetical protein
MIKLGKRGVGLESETLVRYILLVVFLFIVGGLIVMIFTNLGVNDLKTYGCWAANGIMSSNVMFRSQMQVPCKQDLLKDPLSKQDFAIYLTDVWFMYGKGDWDYHITKDDSIQISAFKLKEDMKIKDLFQHLLTHIGKRNLAEKGSISQEDIAKSDYNYIQTGSKGQTLCLHKDLKPKDGQAILKRNRVYYLMYWDDINPKQGQMLSGDLDTGDKIVIVPNSPEVESDEIICCTLKDDKCITLENKPWNQGLINFIGNVASGADSAIKGLYKDVVS